jgi:predicted porin
MKKLLIASAALAMVAGTAQAQSSVTVYGLFDLGYQETDYKNIAGRTRAQDQRDISGINSGGASGNGASASQRIGFRGVEDLGGGLKAGFNYEMGFSGANTSNQASGTTAAHSLNSTQARESNLTLSGGFGAVKIGYGTTLAHATVVGFRPLGGNNAIGELAYTADANSSADYQIHTGMVRTQGVTYTSPTMNGLNVAVSLGEQADKNDSASTTKSGAKNAGFQVNYAAGAFKFSAVSQSATNNVAAVDATTTAPTTVTISSVAYPTSLTVAAANATETKNKLTAVSAAYTIAGVTVDALYAENKQTEAVAGVQLMKNDVKQIGLSYPMGKVRLFGTYGEGDGETTNATTGRSERKGYLIGAMYDLSKRTQAYALTGEVERKYTDAVTNVTAGTKEKVSQVAIGLRHSF